MSVSPPKLTASAPAPPFSVVVLTALFAVGLCISPWLGAHAVLLIAGAGAGYSLSGSV